MKIHVTLPVDAVEFIDSQVASGLFPSRSTALTEAISVWRIRTLVDEYAAAFGEDMSVWDVTVADGLV